MDIFRKPLAVVLFAAGLFVFSQVVLRLAVSNGDALQYATLLPEPKPLPEFMLTDQAGQPFGRDRLRGEFRLLFFGFTHCPDICPATLQQLVLARERIAVPADALEIVLISVDPERDTPQSMADYAASFGDGVFGVTGALDELQKLASSLGIFFEKAPLEGENYDVAHTSAVLLINEHAELQAIFGAPHDVEGLVNDLPLLMASR